MTSFQDLKLWGKQISPAFSTFLISKAFLYHFLVNWLSHNNNKNFFKLFLSVHCGDFIEWIKNICLIHLKCNLCVTEYNRYACCHAHQYIIHCWAQSGLDTYLCQNLPLWKVCLKIYFPHPNFFLQNRRKHIFYLPQSLKLWQPLSSKFISGQPYSSLFIFFWRRWLFMVCSLIPWHNLIVCVQME